MPNCETCVLRAVASEEFAEVLRLEEESLRHALDHLNTKGGPIPENKLRVRYVHEDAARPLREVLDVACGEEFEDCQVAVAAIKKLREVQLGGVPKYLRLGSGEY